MDLSRVLKVTEDFLTSQTSMKEIRLVGFVFGVLFPGLGSSSGKIMVTG